MKILSEASAEKIYLQHQGLKEVCTKERQRVINPLARRYNIYQKDYKNFKDFLNRELSNKGGNK